MDAKDIESFPDFETWLNANTDEDAVGLKVRHDWQLMCEQFGQTLKKFDDDVVLEWSIGLVQLDLKDGSTPAAYALHMRLPENGPDDEITLFFVLNLDNKITAMLIKPQDMQPFAKATLQ